MKLALTKVISRRNRFKDALSGLMVGLVAFAMSACALPTSLPAQLPVDIPGMPKEWSQIQDLMTQLGVPDLSQLADIPGLDAFGGEPIPAGAIQFQGPTEMGLTPGQNIPGTDIRFVQAEAGADAAQFEIAGLRAPRRLGDSLDYDGAWPGVNGVTYHLRLRVYEFSAGSARAAGVQRLIIENVAPQLATVAAEGSGVVFRFPHTVTGDAGATFAGMTLGYRGQEERGANLSGLPEGEYPYRKIGDSVEWAGFLTPNIPVVYHLRMLYYQDANATVGGVVIVSLPGP